MKFFAGRKRLLRSTSALRGLTQAAEAGGQGLYLALLRIDQLDALARWRDAETPEDVTSQAVAAIGEHLPNARIGRSARGVVEFAFPAADAEAARACAARLLRRLEERLLSTSRAISPHLSLGLAPLEAGRSVDEIVARAERALVLTETSAQRCVVWSERDHAEATRRQALARDLRAALNAGQLAVVYQPKLNLRTGAIDSVEALVRWTHPEFGPVTPDVFIPLAEESGDIAHLTRFVLARAIADRAELAGRGHDISVYVNLSGRLVAEEGFCEEILAACAGHERRVGLEITETAVFTHPERALKNLHRLAEGGLAISIDDYGSGLSSLVYLKQLPAAELKIDKLFISSITSSHRDPLIVRSTIDLAHALEMEVTAEGVDQPAALALLKVMGCDRAQGFHIAHPLPLAGLAGFLDDAVGRDLATGPSLFSRISKAARKTYV
jgi:EAL domain-containing protein (putative c-di-GMP-specific phosphodiesterase class I)